MNDTNKNKIFFIMLFALVFISAGAIFMRYIVFQNYTVVYEEFVDEETASEETGAPTE